MQRFVLTALVSVLVCGVSLDARGDVIELEIDFTGSTISAVGGLINIPPDGTINAASAKVRVQASGSLTPLSGLADIRSFLLDLTVSASVLGNVITGFFMGTQNGTAVGNLTAGLANVGLTQTLFMSADAFFDCSGALCGLFGTFPATVNGVQSILPPIALTVNGLSTLGAATAMGAVPLSLGGQTAVLNLSGVEVSRTFIPEPSRVLQFAAAAALVAALFAGRGRQSPR